MIIIAGGATLHTYRDACSANGVTTPEDLRKVDVDVEGVAANGALFGLQRGRGI